MAAQQPRYHENDTDPFSSPIHILVNSADGPREVDLDMRDRDVVLTHRVDHTAIRLLHLHNVREDTVAAARSAVDDFLNDLKLADDRKGHVYPWRPAHTMSEAWDEVHQGLEDYMEAKAEELGLKFEWRHGGFSREMMRNCFNQPIYKVRICEDGAEELTTGARGVPTRYKRIPPEVQEGGSNALKRPPEQDGIVERSEKRLKTDTTGAHGVPTRCKRIPPEVQEGGSNALKRPPEQDGIVERDEKRLKTDS